MKRISEDALRCLMAKGQIKERQFPDLERQLKVHRRVIVQSIKCTLCCLPAWNVKLNAHK